MHKQKIKGPADFSGQQTTLNLDKKVCISSSDSLKQHGLKDTKKNS